MTAFPSVFAITSIDFVPVVNFKRDGEKRKDNLSHMKEPKEKRREKREKRKE